MSKTNLADWVNATLKNNCASAAQALDCIVVEFVQHPRLPEQV